MNSMNISIASIVAVDEKSGVSWSLPVSRNVKDLNGNAGGDGIQVVKDGESLLETVKVVQPVSFRVDTEEIKAVAAGFRPIAKSIEQSKEESTFWQRWPRLTAFIKGCIKVVAFVGFFALNIVITPVLMTVAIASIKAGKGVWAKSIGESGIARFLWGEKYAQTLLDWAENPRSSDQERNVMASTLIPGFNLLGAWTLAGARVDELMEGVRCLQ